jgi:hypothetical protein
VRLLVWARKRHGKMAEIFLLDQEVMPMPQIVLQGTQVLNQDGGFFAWEQTGKKLQHIAQLFTRNA